MLARGTDSGHSRSCKNLQIARIQIPKDQPLIAIQNCPERFLKKASYHGRIVYGRIFTALIWPRRLHEIKRQ
jgi:hypothetical protein